MNLIKEKPKKIILIAIVILAILFGYKLIQNYLTQAARSAFVPPPITVSATKVQSVKWSPYLSSIATLQAINGVNLAPQVAGVVTKIYFDSGQMIQAGQPVISMDTSVLQAQLQNAIADMGYKEVTYKRYDQLYQKKVVTHDQVDQTRSAYNQALATVNQIKAEINQMTVTAPFTGKVGIRLVNLGQYLSPGTVVTNLQQLDPIYVNFSVPSQSLSLLALGEVIEASFDAYPGKIFKGKVTAIDASFNQDTRSISVQGELANPNNELLPAMFGEVKVILPSEKETLVVPQTAVVYTLYGNSIYVVTEKTNTQGKKQQIATQKPVTLGQRRGTSIAILSGLNPSDTVVTSGQIKLQNGSVITIDNSAGLTQ
ncbi:MAG: hypothetical protein A3F12_05155 [Gammaproteobacteria bacterium RIFCSPHIGHO2_12_FULL_38_14]|nr:MAG: hypothetical protein A3F12_05155 [Gammaproteobacteria bacterium RIFCSPHIGHO2_12_FULL_38_14]